MNTTKETYYQNQLLDIYTDVMDSSDVLIVKEGMRIYNDKTLSIIEKVSMLWRLMGITKNEFV